MAIKAGLQKILKRILHTEDENIVMGGWELQNLKRRADR
jgi:hypothetical protein